MNLRSGACWAAPLLVIGLGGHARADDAPVAEQPADAEGLTLSGTTGLLHTTYAPRRGGGRPLRVALTVDGVSTGALCTSSQPCVDAKTGARTASDDVTQFGGTLGASLALATLGSGVLEGTLASRVSTTSSGVATLDSNLAVIGATSLGIRYGTPVASAVDVGATAALLLPGARGFGGFDLGATGARFGGAVTADLRTAGVPLRVGGDVAYVLDNSAKAIADTETRRGIAISRIERYALGISRTDHVDLALGGEVLLGDGTLRPFLEYALAIPVNRQGYQCNPLDGTDRCLGTDAVAPSTLTAGLRAFPWRSGLGFLAAVDVGVTGSRTFIAEVAPVAPYRIFVGASYDVDLAPSQSTEPVTVDGIVRDTEGEPIAGARVRGSGGEATSNNAGAFTLRTALGGGLVVTRDGFLEGTCKVDSEGPKPHVSCALSLAPNAGTLVVVLRDAKTGGPAAGVEVYVKDSAGVDVAGKTDKTGAARFAGRAAGAARVSTSDDAHFEQAGDSSIVEGEVGRIEWSVVPVPTGDQSSVVADAQRLLLKPRVAFTADGATVDASSIASLNELVHAIRRRPEPKHLELRAYADGALAPGDAEAATARARAIATWLVAHGVPAERLAPRGLPGDAQPPAGALPGSVRVEVVPGGALGTPSASRESPPVPPPTAPPAPTP